jgi:hypothetical protein
MVVEFANSLHEILIIYRWPSFGLAEKSWLKALFANIYYEKNTPKW